VAEAIDVNHDQPATRRSSLFDLPCRIAPGIRSRRVASTPPSVEAWGLATPSRRQP